MANIIQTPNMKLPVPVVGVDYGPDWASNLNACLTSLDGHDHSVGRGQPVTPLGLSINADLPFLGNNATGLRSVRLNSQSGTLTLSTDLSAVYSVAGDLYYNDGSGNKIRLTSNGAVAGTPGNIANLVTPAALNYSSTLSTFQFQSNSISSPTVSAAIDSGPITLRNLSSGSAGVTLSPQSSIAANYTLTLPQVPSALSVQTLDQSGNMSTVSWDYVGQNMTSVGANAIGVFMTPAGANAVAATRTRALGAATVGLGGVAVTTGSGLYTTTSSTYGTVTNLTVSIVTSGRPVYIGLICDPTTAQGGGASSLSFAQNAATTNAASGVIPVAIYRGGTRIIFPQLAVSLTNSSTTNAIYVNAQGYYVTGTVTNADSIAYSIPPSSVSHVDIYAPAGTNTYTIQTAAITPNSTVSFTNVSLVVYEL